MDPIPSKEEYEEMLRIVRSANPPGMQRHYHLDRLMEEWRNKQITSTNKN